MAKERTPSREKKRPFVAGVESQTKAEFGAKLFRPYEDPERAQKLREALESFRVEAQELDVEGAETSRQQQVLMKEATEALISRSLLTDEVVRSFTYRLLRQPFDPVAEDWVPKDAASEWPVDLRQLYRLALHMEALQGSQQKLSEAYTRALKCDRFCVASQNAATSSAALEQVLPEGRCEFIFMRPPTSEEVKQWSSKADSVIDLAGSRTLKTVSSVLRESVLSGTKVGAAADELLLMISSLPDKGSSLLKTMFRWVENMPARDLLATAAYKDFLAVKLVSLLAGRDIAQYLSRLKDRVVGANFLTVMQVLSNYSVRQSPLGPSAIFSGSGGRMTDADNPYVPMISIWEQGFAPVRAKNNTLALLYVDRRKLEDALSPATTTA